MALKQSHSKVNVTVLSAISGDVLWGPHLVDREIDAGNLSDQVTIDLKRVGQQLVLQQGGEVLQPLHKLLPLFEENDESTPFEEGLVIAGLWTACVWPVRAVVFLHQFGHILEAFLEKPPLWKTILEAKDKALKGYVKGFLKKVDVELGKIAAGDLDALHGPDKFLELMGWHASQPGERVFDKLPIELQEKLHGLFSLAMSDVERESFIEQLLLQIADIIAGLHSESRKKRLLVQWPTKRLPKIAVGLFIAAALQEQFADHDGHIEASDVDEVVAGMFKGRPDLPLIRRSLMELCFLEQPKLIDLRPSQLKLNSEACQQALEQLLQP
eukprot:TRINITY_DN1407_c1_g1_i1.p1 TRINITY_DN1407_c1_g1~~TRINITY_DN1407_c1_g1_i1.p1  ORF type:complete len:327 (+),score=60.20 TRINITY_DN1407_c1_g1_i1:56-1036(+)